MRQILLVVLNLHRKCPAQRLNLPEAGAFTAMGEATPRGMVASAFEQPLRSTYWSRYQPMALQALHRPRRARQAWTHFVLDC